VTPQRTALASVNTRHEVRFVPVVRCLRVFQPVHDARFLLLTTSRRQDSVVFIHQQAHT